MKRKALILPLMAFGLGLGSFVGTANATVVKEVKADNSYANIYYEIPDNVVGSYNVKANYNRQGDADNWKSVIMTRIPSLSSNGISIYGANIEMVYSGLGKLQFQLLDGDEWKSQEEVINSWTGEDVFEGKKFVYGNSSWTEIDVPVKGRYVVGNFGTCNWDMNGATYMAHDMQYEATVDMEFGDEFKIAYWDGISLTDYCGYNMLTPNANSYFCFTNGSDGNVQCYASGTYDLYFTDGNYDGSYKISSAINGDYTAEQLAARLMGMDISSGTCKDKGKYDVCRDMYDEMPDKEAFMNFGSLEIPQNQEDANYKYNKQMKDGYDRMMAWAAANGDVLTKDGVAQQNRFNPEFNESFASISETDSIALIVAISAVAGASLLGIYLLKKKKHN